MEQRPEMKKPQERETVTSTAPVDREQVDIPVVVEEIVTGSRKVRTGGVRVHKRVQERVEHIEMPVVSDTVDIRRVPVNRVVDAPPPIRQEGGTVIVPVVKEEIVVTKRLVVIEELHLIRRRTKTRQTRDVPVRKEHVEIERVDAEGRRVRRRESGRTAGASGPILKDQPTS
jgi:uncharacterized protein (TIGR02271 family)